MGISRTAFSCYGNRIETPAYPKLSIEDLNAIIPTAERVEIVEWGSRQYGGRWGLVLVLKETYESIDFDSGVGLRALPRDRDRDLMGAVARLQDARHALQEAGHPVELIRDAAWFVGGVTY